MGLSKRWFRGLSQFATRPHGMAIVMRRGGHGPNARCTPMSSVGGAPHDQRGHGARTCRVFALALLVVALVALAGPHSQAADAKLPKQIIAQVTQVLSGDSFLIRYEGRTLTVRLAAADAPERDQTFFDGARAALSKKVMGKTPRIQPLSGDMTKGITAWVSIEGNSINKQLVAEGWAWFDDSVESPALADAQVAAQRRKLGLWATGTPIPPWEFREQAAAELAATTKPAEEDQPSAPKRKLRRIKGKKPPKEEDDALREVAQKFMDAAQKNDLDAAKKQLTEKAAKQFSEERLASVAPGAGGSAQVGEATIARDKGEVKLNTAAQPGGQERYLMLRREHKKWHVYGLVLALATAEPDKEGDDKEKEKKKRKDKEDDAKEKEADTIIDFESPEESAKEPGEGESATAEAGAGEPAEKSAAGSE